MNCHLSQEELVDQVYGLGGRDAHLLECPDCSHRFEALLAAKGQTRPEEIPLSAEFLAEQRRAIHARIERSGNMTARWAPALAAAFLLAIGVFLFYPRPHRLAAGAPMPVAHTEVLSNEQLFSDLYSMEDSFEPRAATPIHALFEDESGEQ